MCPTTEQPGIIPPASVLKSSLVVKGTGQIQQKSGKRKIFINPGKYFRVTATFIIRIPVQNKLADKSTLQQKVNLPMEHGIFLAWQTDRHLRSIDNLGFAFDL